MGEVKIVVVLRGEVAESAREDSYFLYSLVNAVERAVDEELRSIAHAAYWLLPAEEYEEKKEKLYSRLRKQVEVVVEQE